MTLLLAHIKTYGKPTRTSKVIFFAVHSFILLGFLRTVLSLGNWPLLDVLRDSAIWYYGLFFLAATWISRDERASNALWKHLNGIWIVALIWVVLNHVSNWEIADLSPTFPGADRPLLRGSGSENMQHAFLGALVLFMRLRNRSFRVGRTWVSAIMIGLGLVVVFLYEGRGVKVAIVLATALLFVATAGARPSLWLSKRQVTVFAILVTCLIVAIIIFGLGPLAHVGSLERFQEVSERRSSGTVFWRSVWWDAIQEQVTRNDPLFGLGFGYNLGVLNPFLVDNILSTTPVRSPHNINVTIYGRMGLIGLISWLTLLSLSLGWLFLRVRTGRNRLGNYMPERRQELAFWLTFLVVTVVNSSFGVLMEGPVLGVWFWFALGFTMGRATSKEAVYEPPVQA